MPKKGTLTSYENKTNLKIKIKKAFIKKNVFT